MVNPDYKHKTGDFATFAASVLEIDIQRIELIKDLQFSEDEKYYNAQKGVNTSQLMCDTHYQNNRKAIKNNRIKINSAYRHTFKINFGRKGRF